MTLFVMVQYLRYFESPRKPDKSSFLNFKKFAIMKIISLSAILLLVAPCLLTAQETNKSNDLANQSRLPAAVLQFLSQHGSKTESDDWLFFDAKKSPSKFSEQRFGNCHFDLLTINFSGIPLAATASQTFNSTSEPNKNTTASEIIKPANYDSQMPPEPYHAPTTRPANYYGQMPPEPYRAPTTKPANYYGQMPPENTQKPKEWVENSDQDNFNKSIKDFPGYSENLPLGILVELIRSAYVRSKN